MIRLILPTSEKTPKAEGFIKSSSAGRFVATFAVGVPYNFVAVVSSGTRYFTYRKANLTYTNYKQLSFTRILTEIWARTKYR